MHCVIREYNGALILCTKALFDAGADPSVENSEGRTAEETAKSAHITMISDIFEGFDDSLAISEK